MAKSILIVGGTGFVGSTLARALNEDPENQVHCTYRGPYTPIKGVAYHHLPEVTDKDKCKIIAYKALPEVTIYCAGSNEPNIYEEDQFKAQIVFSGGSGAMLSATESLKSKYIYISSDYAFSGGEGNYSEIDNLLPSSQLGKAKVGGENFVRTRSLNHVVIRCAPLMGRGPIDHPSWMDKWREALFLEKPLKVKAKTYQNPVPIHSLVSAIQFIIRTNLKNETLHLGGLSKVTQFELATILAAQLGYNPGLIVSSDEQEHTYLDFSLNFTESLKLLQANPLFLEQCLDLIQ